jgi:hypothetical protein
MRLFHAVSKMVLALGMAGCLPAFAQFVPIGTPNAGYTGGTTLISISQPDCTTVTSLTGGAETVGLGASMVINTATVFPGGCGGWGTWGSPPNTETATPRIVDTQLTSTTLSLSAPAQTFGFEVEPENVGSYTFTATFYNGGTAVGTISIPVVGNAGARLIAATSATPITGVTISAPGSNGFAMANFRFALPTAPTVPTLRTAAFAGLGLLLAAAGVLLVQRQAVRAVRP